MKECCKKWKGAKVDVPTDSDCFMIPDFCPECSNPLTTKGCRILRERNRARSKSWQKDRRYLDPTMSPLITALNQLREQMVSLQLTIIEIREKLDKP